MEAYEIEAILLLFLFPPNQAKFHCNGMSSLAKNKGQEDIVRICSLE